MHVEVLDARSPDQPWTADRCCAELNEQIKSGDVLLKRLSRIVVAARPVGGDCETAAAPDLKAVAAAAQAFAERARSRLGPLAA